MQRWPRMLAGGKPGKGSNSASKWDAAPSMQSAEKAATTADARSLPFLLRMV